MAPQRQAADPAPTLPRCVSCSDEAAVHLLTAPAGQLTCPRGVGRGRRVVGGPLPRACDVAWACPAAARSPVLVLTVQRSYTPSSPCCRLARRVPGPQKCRICSARRLPVLLRTPPHACWRGWPESHIRDSMPGRPTLWGCAWRTHVRQGSRHVAAAPASGQPSVTVTRKAPVCSCRRGHVPHGAGRRQRACPAGG